MDPGTLLAAALREDDVQAVDRILTTYPGGWEPVTEEGITVYEALDAAVENECEACV